MPCLLEIVELAVAGPAPLPDQPENWLLEKEITPKSWRSLGKIEWNEIQRLLDRPQQLWNDPTCGARRVTAGYPRAMREPASLYLVQPDRIESISVWSERNPFDARRSVKGHRLARLRYAGMLHHFDVTDPDFADRHYPRIPAPNEPGIEVKLTRPDETLVCVSVTGEYQGHHYKIAAAFFEPPAESQRG
jgi:hypothetical protein